MDLPLAISVIIEAEARDIAQPPAFKGNILDRLVITHLGIHRKLVPTQRIVSIGFACGILRVAKVPGIFAMVEDNLPGTILSTCRPLAKNILCEFQRLNQLIYVGFIVIHAKRGSSRRSKIKPVH